MPTLPTLTVTDAQATRLLAAFGSVENYKAWLKEALIARVVEHEAREVEQNAAIARENNRVKLQTEISLGP